MMKNYLIRVVLLCISISCNAQEDNSKENHKLDEKSSTFVDDTILNMVFNKDSLIYYLKQDALITSSKIIKKYKKFSNKELLDTLQRTYEKTKWKYQLEEKEIGKLKKNYQEMVLVGLHRKKPEFYAGYGAIHFKNYIHYSSENKPKNYYKGFLYLIYSVKLNSKYGLYLLADLYRYEERYEKMENAYIKSSNLGDKNSSYELFRLYNGEMFADNRSLNSSFIDEKKAKYYFGLALNRMHIDAIFIQAKSLGSGIESFNLLTKLHSILVKEYPFYSEELSFSYIELIYTLRKKYAEKWKAYQEKNGIKELDFVNKPNVLPNID